MEALHGLSSVMFSTLSDVLNTSKKELFDEHPPTDIDHTFYNFNDRAILKALYGLELGKVVHGDRVQLEGEASAVTAVLAIHQQLVDFLNQLQGTHLRRTVSQLVGALSPVNHSKWIMTILCVKRLKVWGYGPSEFWEKCVDFIFNPAVSGMPKCSTVHDDINSGILFLTRLH